MYSFTFVTHLLVRGSQPSVVFVFGLSLNRWEVVQRTTNHSWVRSARNTDAARVSGRGRQVRDHLARKMTPDKQHGAFNTYLSTKVWPNSINWAANTRETLGIYRGSSSSSPWIRRKGWKKSQWLPIWHHHHDLVIYLPLSQFMAKCFVALAVMHIRRRESFEPGMYLLQTGK